MDDHAWEPDVLDRRAGARRDARQIRRQRRRPAGNEARQLAGSRAGRVPIGAVIAIAIATLAGLAALWPAGDQDTAPVSTAAPTTAATVERVVDAPCTGPARQRCRQLIISVEAARTTLALGPVQTAPQVGPGDRIRVSKINIASGTPDADKIEPYAFAGVDRHRSVVWLAIALALLALAALRWRGLLAVVGVGLSLLLLTSFVVPALLAGSPAILVALVGSLAVMFVTLVLTNGVGAQTLAAALGVSVTLALTSVLALLASRLAALDGTVSEVAGALAAQNPQLSLQGIVIAGMVIGALGVLADTGVTQASAVMALRHANPLLQARELYRRALTVGRDTCRRRSTPSSWPTPARRCRCS